MNEKQLSKRLECVAGFLLRGKVLADIGSDHAYLPCYAFLKRLIPSAVAGEVNEGPFQSARQLVEKLNLTSHISVRLGNGLSVITENEAEQITIAGMGGSLIASILEEGKTSLLGVERLILQPNVAADKVREWLYRNHWTLVHEEILEEDEKIYEILISEPGEDTSRYAEQKDKKMLFGPYLLCKKNDAFQKKWQMELKKNEAILASFNKAAQSKENERKKHEIEKQIRLIKEVLS